MKRAINVLILNFLWIVFSIPLVTIGASTCAAFYVNLKLVDNEDCNVFKDFIKGFKTNFKQGTVLWTFTAPCIYALCLMWQLIANEGASFVTGTGAVIFTSMVIFSFLYSYPMIARYENKLQKIIKNSIGLSIQFFKKTILLISFVALEIIIFGWLKKYFIFVLIFAPEFIIYTISIFSKKIFKDLEMTVKVQREEESEKA